MLAIDRETTHTAPLLPALPLLSRLSQALLEHWPGHRGHLLRSFASHDAQGLQILERVAARVLRLAEDDDEGLPRLCADYRYLCEELLLPEEIYFRRHNRYRLSSSAAAQAEVHRRPGLRVRYLNGLLLSSLFSANHAGIYGVYLRDFLPRNRPSYRHLEVGCGHGLLLSLAAEDPRCAALTAWDVSPARLAMSRRCLSLLAAGTGEELPICFALRDLLAEAQDTGEDPESYDSAVISEGLERLEDPVAALVGLRRVLAPGGRLFINLPVNSPAPEHIYLLRTPEEALALVQKAGLRVLDHRCLPATGATEERARRHGLTINTVIIADLPEQRDQPARA